MKSYSEAAIERAKPSLSYVIYRSNWLSRPFAVDEVYWGTRRFRNAFDTLANAKAFVQKLAAPHQT